MRECVGDPGRAVAVVWLEDATFGLLRLQWTADTVVSTESTRVAELGRAPGPGPSPGDWMPPSVLGCATVAGTTHALTSASDGAMLLVSRWLPSAAAAEASLRLGTFESDRGAIALDAEGLLFLAVDGAEAAALHVFRLVDGSGSEIGARTIPGFRNVLGTIPLAGTTALLFRQWSFLAAVEVAPDGSISPPTILTDVVCRSRSAPIEWGGGFVLPTGCMLRGLGMIGVCTG